MTGTVHAGHPSIPCFISSFTALNVEAVLTVTLIPELLPEAQRLFWGFNLRLNLIKALAFYTAGGSVYKPALRTHLRGNGVFIMNAFLRAVCWFLVFTLAASGFGARLSAETCKALKL